MKKLMLCLTVVMLFAMSGCEKRTDSTDEQMKNNQEKIIATANQQVGMPAIVNFQEKRMLKMIYEYCNCQSASRNACNS
ncbi:MAG: hypothetical protein ABR968_14310 [Bacteroidales bacterium]